MVTVTAMLKTDCNGQVQKQEGWQQALTVLKEEDSDVMDYHINTEDDDK